MEELVVTLSVALPHKIFDIHVPYSVPISLVL